VTTEITLGDYPPQGEPYVAMKATDRQSIVEVLERVKDQWGNAGYFEIIMPCGYSKKFQEYADIPFEDLPCACGQEGRYLIIYKKE